VGALEGSRYLQPGAAKLFFCWVCENAGLKDAPQDPNFVVSGTVDRMEWNDGMRQRFIL
jgi:hypothetical protein